VSIGVPLGREHDPRSRDNEILTTVRLGDHVFDLDDEATTLWSQGLRFLERRDLAEQAKRHGIEGDPVAMLMSSGLVRALDQSCIDLALVPLGVAIGNRADAPGTFEINVGAQRPVGVDSLVFAVWSASYWGRSLRAACKDVAQISGLSVEAVAMHVLNQCEELLGNIFWLDIAAGTTS
jgi:hypothetical protein